MEVHNDIIFIEAFIGEELAHFGHIFALDVQIFENLQFFTKGSDGMDVALGPIFVRLFQRCD
jgi:hypothetical protein